MKFDEYKKRFDSFDDEAIGEGGYKRVYRAHHSDFGPVVVKVFFNGIDERGQREIDILKSTEFANVPCLLAVDEVEYEGAKTTVLVEELIEGECLADVVASGHCYSLAEAISFLEQSLEVVREISAAGIVHRDIKPDNIIMSEGRPFFLDFGIARVIGAANSLTKTGAFIPHTPGYAAPEVVRQDKDLVDVRSDLYSLGVVVYELISGKNPFREGARAWIETDLRTLTVTPKALKIPGDDHGEFMGFIASLTSRSIYARPKDAGEALLWLQAAKRACSL